VKVPAKTKKKSATPRPGSPGHRIRREPAVRTPAVIDWIREKIRVGRLVPGQRLVEADITAATGASRRRVREVLQRLETEGLVEIEEFRGASVKRYSWDEVRQIYLARMALEGLAAGEFAAADAAAAKHRLVEIQEELNQWEHTGNHERFARLNAAWHDLIIDSAGNEYVRQFLTRLTVPIYRFLFATMYSSQRIDSANADHRRITAAIVAGDAASAEQEMRGHIRHGLEALGEVDAGFHG
jgi:DNA-binding GntR family transcriptional regulator